MLHNFTLVYLSVYLALLHACSNNTRPVSALTLFFLFLKLTVVSSNAFHLFTCRVSTLWPACQPEFSSFMWSHTQLCSLSLLVWNDCKNSSCFQQDFFKKYTFSGTRVRGEKKSKCLSVCFKMPSMSPSARYTRSRNRSLVDLKLSQCH